MHTELRCTYDIFFENYSRFIMACIKNFIRINNIPINYEDVDDIYQNIAIKIIKNKYIEKYDNEKSSMSTWIGTISRTTAIDYYRMKKHHYNETDISEADSCVGQEDVQPGLQLPGGVLSRRQAQVISLFFQEGLEAGEIAGRLGISPQTVRSIKFQALEKLRRHYGAVSEEEVAQRRKAP
ncbi:RNA polymerase sigma factor [Desulfovibrio sp.]